MKPDHQPYFISIGQNLLRLRLKNGLSQRQLAERCGMDRAKISKIENGQEDFMFSTLLNLALALKVNVKKLMG